jgi:hypothetical protein
MDWTKAPDAFARHHLELVAELDTERAGFVRIGERPKARNGEGGRRAAFVQEVAPKD